MTPAVRDFFSTIRDDPRLPKYEQYLQGIAPDSAQGVFWRFVFAYTSIHTTYASNIRAYQALRRPEAWRSEAALRDALHGARCGMHNNRARYLWKFAHDFFDRRTLDLDECRGVRALRNTLIDKLLGIGIAKISFALEMCFPLQREVVCLDVHHLRLYGHKDKVWQSTYEQIEDDWCQRSAEVGYAPFVTRNLYWDTLKEKPSPRFWSFVFEPEVAHLSLQDAQTLGLEDVEDVSVTDVIYSIGQPDCLTYK